MRRLSFVFAALAILLYRCPVAWAQAEPVLGIVFSGNSWGYLKPCPS
jgi:hypothetical protein